MQWQQRARQHSKVRHVCSLHARHWKRASPHPLKMHISTWQEEILCTHMMINHASTELQKLLINPRFTYLHQTKKRAMQRPHFLIQNCKIFPWKRDLTSSTHRELLVMQVIPQKNVPTATMPRQAIPPAPEPYLFLKAS